MAQAQANRQHPVYRLSRDEQRCLVLCDLAHSVWEKMKDNVDMAWPAFRSVSKQLNETSVRERHDFKSVQLCLLTTYALKVPVLVAKGCDREVSTDASTGAIFLAIACFDNRLDDMSTTQDIVESIQRDLVGKLRDGKGSVRVVICGEGSGAVFAQRVTVKVLENLERLSYDAAETDQSRSMVSCVSIGSYCKLLLGSRGQYYSVQGCFTSLVSSVHVEQPTNVPLSVRQHDHHRTLDEHVGKHFVIIGQDGNIQLWLMQECRRNRLALPPNNSEWRNIRARFGSNLKLYLAVSPPSAAEFERPALNASADMPVPMQDQSCVLCSEMCGLFHSSAADRQVDTANVEVLQRALKYVCASVLQRLRQEQQQQQHQPQQQQQRQQLKKLLRDEHIFGLLKRFSDLAVGKTGEKKAGEDLHESICAAASSEDNLSEIVTDDHIVSLLERVMRDLTSVLPCRWKNLLKRATQVDQAAATGGGVGLLGGGLAAWQGGQAALGAAASAIVAAAPQSLLANALVAVGINAAPSASAGAVAGAAASAGMAAAAPVLLGAGLLAGGVAPGMHLHKKYVEEKRSWEERNNRYRDILRLFLMADFTALMDRRWSCLSALQLEALLVRKVPGRLQVHNLEEDGIPKFFAEITEKTLPAATQRVEMAKAMYKLRHGLTHTCHIALVGPQNAGKSTMVKKVWHRADVPNIGRENHTRKAGVYIMTDKVKVLDFPGTTSRDESVRNEFRRLLAMAGIVIFTVKFDGSPDKNTIGEYKSVKELAGEAPLLVCLTQVSCCWYEGDEDEEVHSASHTDSLRQKWAEALACNKEDVLLTELTRPSPRLTEWGVAGCDEIRRWLKDQLLRMQIYDNGDADLDLAVHMAAAS